MSDKAHMHDSGESYGGVQPTKQPNKRGRPPEEAVEGRPPTKENAGQPNPYWTPSQGSGPSGLDRVREAARQDGKTRFTALLHHVTVDLLRESYHSLKKKAAPGVDGVTWEDYGRNLEANVIDLQGRIHRGAYRARPSRRVWIPKGDGRQRPLGIAALEDKVVQHAIGTVLNRVWEEDFLGFSYGFRPGRSQHDALDALYVGITRKKVNWVLDLDVRSFFDKVDHDWMKRFVEHRIGDRRVVRLIQKWLKAGVMEQERWFETEERTPQGSVITPRTQKVTSVLSEIIGPTRQRRAAPVRRSRWNGDAVAKHDRIIAHEHLLDHQAHDTLPFDHVERVGGSTQPREKHRERLRQAEVRCPLLRLLRNRLQLGAQPVLPLA